ncbi:MAG: hypothetical protein ACXWJZ_01450 [Burkholderiaceae bacterium]
MSGTLTSNYPGGFANGVTIRGIPLTVTNPGKVFWVYNGTALQQGQRGGSDSNRGTYDSPFATINYAVTQCTANRGDIIFVKPGHAETISNATTLVLNVAGVAIVGLGVGSSRPTLTFSTATTANIPVTAANITVANILHKANFADIVSAYTATGTATPTDFTLYNNEFRDGSSVLNFIKTVTGNATANSMDGFTYSTNRVFGLSTTAASQACIMAAANDRQRYVDNFVVYPVLNDTAVLVDFGANNQTNLDMGRNRVFRPSTSTTGGSLFSGGSTGSTGYVYDNYSWHLDNSAGLLAPTGTKLGFQNNYSMITGAADKSGLINPAAV